MPKMDIKIENGHINLICHGCLTTDRKVRRVVGEFRKMFHFLRNDDKIDVLSRELLLCWECVAFLKKLKMFRARIRKAECILVTYLHNYYNEDGYPNTQCLSSLKSTHIYTYTYESYEGEKLLHEVANSDNIELKDEEDHLEIKLTADIKVECDDNIKEDCNNSNNIECNDNIIQQHNDSNDNDSDYYDQEDNIEKSSRVKKKIVEKEYENICTATTSSNDNDSDYSDKEFKIWIKKENIDKSSIVKKKNNTNMNKYYEKLALVTKIKDVSKNYIQYTESVCLSQKEYENVLKLDYSSKIKKMRFKCIKCQQCFLRKLDLLRHISFEHNEQATFPYKCAACDTMITSSEHLDEHWTEAHTNMLKCTLCSKVYCTMPQIKRHVYKYHRKIYACKQCELEFRSLPQFKTHYKVTHELVICDYCNASFSKKKTLLSHMRLYHIPVDCKLCNRTYKNKRYLKNHNTVIHPELTSGETNKELSYCVECDKQFPSVIGYQRHLTGSQHTLEMKIRVPCPECGKELSKNHLEHHIRFFHRKVTKFYCKQCDKYYARNSGLKEHIARYHKKIAPPKDKFCDICGRGFSTNKILQNHRRTHTGERPYNCNYCPAAFAQRGAMKTHQKTQHKNLDLPS